ncbi:hypothetical protein OG216_31870 [Streptomycetaceae bacterium NBC_01309]
MDALLKLWITWDASFGAPMAPAPPPAPPPPDNSKTILEPGGAHIPDSLTGGFSKLLAFGSWIVLGLCVAGLLATAGRMAYAHKTGGEVHIPGLLMPMVACVIVGSASAIVGIVAGP